MKPQNHPRDRSYRVAVLVAIVVVALSLAACGPAQPASSAPSTPGSPAASSSGAVQRFSVDLSSGTYVPNEITAKAGVPVQITFGQAQGCVQTLVFPSFKIQADLSQGPKTFDLGALQPGEYTWSCGMNMQHGVLRVQ